MEIKITLKQLTQLFIRAAANVEIPAPIRQFAAQLTVLTAHTERIEAKIDALTSTLDEQIAELASHLLASREKAPTATSSPVASASPEMPMDEEDEAKAMAEQVLRETEDEVAAITKAPPAAVTPLRKPAVAGKEAS